MTGKELYELALELLACKNADGTHNEDCKDYMSRSVGLINILLAENIWLDRILRRDKSVLPVYINSLDDALRCNSSMARAVLPYGLAALLVADEDSNAYKLMTDRYLQSIKIMKEEAVGTRHDIADCYGYNE